MKRLVLLTLLLSLALLTGCATMGGAADAIATLAPTSGNTATGTVELRKQSDGSVEVTVALSAVPPGTHGFHIHEKGDCGDNGNAAGGHFNPMATPHGAPGTAQHHAGDFGNVTADANGNVRTTFKTRSITLEGAETSAVGHAVILHANPDDLVTQPTGNAGGRIACGVVQLD